MHGTFLIPDVRFVDLFIRWIVIPFFAACSTISTYAFICSLAERLRKRKRERQLRREGDLTIRWYEFRDIIRSLEVDPDATASEWLDMREMLLVLDLAIKQQGLSLPSLESLAHKSFMRRRAANGKRFSLK